MKGRRESRVAPDFLDLEVIMGYTGRKLGECFKSTPDTLFLEMIDIHGSFFHQVTKRLST